MQLQVSAVEVHDVMAQVLCVLRPDFYVQYNKRLQAAVGEGGSLPMSPDPDPIKILTTDAEVAGWNSDGLPNDQVRLAVVLRPTSCTRINYPRRTSCVLEACK